MSVARWPKWRNEDLAEHLAKRRRFDTSCWVEILKRSAPMTAEEYEQASYDAYAKGVLEYDAEEERHRRRIHRFDARGIKTIVSIDRRVMITCFHFHPGGQHVPGSVSAPLGDKCAELLDVLEGRAEAGELTLFEIKADKRNLPKGKLRSKAGPLLTKIAALKIRLGIHV